MLVLMALKFEKRSNLDFQVTEKGLTAWLKKIITNSFQRKFIKMRGLFKKLIKQKMNLALNIVLVQLRTKSAQYFFH